MNNGALSGTVSSARKGPATRMTMPNDLAAHLAAWLDSFPEPMWLVGGAVRDWLARRGPARDLDLVTSGDPRDLAQRMAAALGGFPATIGPDGSIVRVSWPGAPWHLDIAGLDGATILDDLARRDFTIDAIALPASPGALIALTLAIDPDAAALEAIDPLGGREDLHNHRLRLAYARSLDDDPVRVLRAARLATALDLRLDGELVARAQALADRVASAPPERITAEIYAMMAQPHGGDALRRLDDLGALTALVPPLAACRGVTQGFLHYWDVFDHTLSVLDYVDRVVELMRIGLISPELACSEDAQVVDDRLPHPQAIDLAGHNAELLARLDEIVAEGQTRLTMMKVAAIFHDTGKPLTRVEDGLRVHFPGHPDAGAPLTRAVLDQWRVGRVATRYITTVVAGHMRPGKLAERDRWSLSGARRYAADMGDAALDVAIFSLADHLGVYGPTPLTPFWPRHRNVVAEIVQLISEEPSVIVPAPLISGHDLIDGLGMPPGAMIGRAIEQVRAAQIDGTIVTREEALALAREIVSAEPRDAMKQ
jgi:poly(A) polymerase